MFVCLAGLISTMSLNDNKAGMQGLDKEHINQIIYEASKGQLLQILWKSLSLIISSVHN